MASKKKKPTNRILRLIVTLAVVAALVYFFPEEFAPPESAPVATEEGVRASGDHMRLVTWNLYNFGRSKDASEIDYMANLLRDHELVAIQEVSTGPAGAQAVARLVDALERTGADWDYRVSDPTQGPGSERYAYLWKPSRVQLIGRTWLEQSLADEIDREPYLARFESRATGKRALLVSFHAIPRSKKPAKENRLLVRLHELYPDDNLLIMGDFNQSQKHEAFDELKAAGFDPVLVNQKTSLRMKPKEDGHLANEYDNIFFESDALRAGQADVIDFTADFSTLKEARTISDHLPVAMEVMWW